MFPGKESTTSRLADPSNVGLLWAGSSRLGSCDDRPYGTGCRLQRLDSRAKSVSSPAQKEERSPHGIRCPSWRLCRTQLWGC